MLWLPSIKKAVFFAGALSLLLVIGGCGGGGGGSSQTTSVARDSGTDPHSLSKAAFIKRADAICVETKQRTTIGYREYSRRNTIPTSGPGLATKAADLVDTVFVPVYEKQIDAIGELGAPQGDQGEIEAILVAMRQGIEGAKKEPLAFIHSPTSLDHASRLAVAYGLEACGNGSS